MGLTRNLGAHRRSPTIAKDSGLEVFLHRH